MPRKQESTRREFLQTIGAGAVAFALPSVARAVGEPRAPASGAKEMTFDLRAASGFARLADGSVADAAALKLERKWNGDICRSRLTNSGSQPFSVREVVLFAGPHAFGAET